MRLALDTDVIVAAMRSPGGASAAILQLARAHWLTLTVTVPLCVEYEAVCFRAEHLSAAGFDLSEGEAFLDGLIGLAEPAFVWFLWRPQLRDPGDELVLEAAVNSRADAIVTFNRRHFRDAAKRFGVDILLPSDVLRRLF